MYIACTTRDTASVDAAGRKGSAKLYANNSKLTISRWKLRKDNTKEEAEEYLCHSCYIPKENWQDALPQGYEDVKSMKELIDRKKRLSGNNQGSRSVSHTKSK